LVPEGSKHEITLALPGRESSPNRAATRPRLGESAKHLWISRSLGLGRSGGGDEARRESPALNHVRSRSTYFLRCTEIAGGVALTLASSGGVATTVAWSRSAGLAKPGSEGRAAGPAPPPSSLFFCTSLGQFAARETNRGQMLFCNQAGRSGEAARPLPFGPRAKRSRRCT